MFGIKIKLWVSFGKNPFNFLMNFQKTLIILVSFLVSNKVMQLLICNAAI